MLRAPTIGLAILALTIATGTARAQSSGNFSATGTGASCMIDAGGVLSGGIGLGSFTANISTGSGNGTTLDIRPSLVTGLFTRTKIDTSVSTASADIGIKVCITVDGSMANVLPTACAVYDQRFQQISSGLFSQIAACTPVPIAGSVCTIDADCAALGTNVTCNNPTGNPGAGICVQQNASCNFELILSTLSAHSFDFVVAVDNKKPHEVVASWTLVGLPANNTGNSSVASCVGPGILTVTQVKVFNNSGALNFP
jgi:hypothetical protein